MQYDSELDQLIPEGPHRMTVGLRRVVDTEWIVDQPDFDDQLRERQRLIEDRDDVIASTNQSLAAQRELLAMVSGFVCRVFPQRYARRGDTVHCSITNRDIDLSGEGMLPIEAVGRLVPDDFCLLETIPDHDPPDEDQPAENQPAENQLAARYRLTAAVVCFPTRWRLAPKVGRDLSAIHGPVPGYSGPVSSGVERLFSAIDSERILARSNWSILDSPTLYQPQREPISDARAASIEAFWLRSERQTVRRLPRSKAVAFGIRIRQWPISEVLERPTLKHRLLEHIRTMPADMKRYKRMDHFERVLANHPSAF